MKKRRKKYATPKIKSEKVFEQTALACESSGYSLGKESYGGVAQCTNIKS